MMQEESRPPPLLDVVDLRKTYPVFGPGVRRRVIGETRAVDGVSFSLEPGTTLGLVGESGCGKTTCARAILRAIKPTGGAIRFRREDGRVVDLARLGAGELKPLRREMQMIFQDPMSSLNPRMTVGDIVEEPLVIHRIGTKAERVKRVESLLERVGLPASARQRFPHAFSGGQRQRVGIARALILQPRLVVCDEAVSALDVSVQARVLELLDDLREEFGLTYIFVSHDLGVVRGISDHIAVMYAGKIVETGPAEEVFTRPKHAYTRALLSAIPHPDPDRKMNPLRYDPESQRAVPLYPGTSS